MPLYNYQCRMCKAEVEVLQKDEDPAPMCPNCMDFMVRTIGNTNFVLKGSGWGRDGYTKGKETDNDD